MRPSWVRRQRGLQAYHKYGLFACQSCEHLLIAKQGQKTKRCPFCGKKQWLGDRKVIFGHDDLQYVVIYRTGLEMGRRVLGFQCASDLIKPLSITRKPAPPVSVVQCWDAVTASDSRLGGRGSWWC